MTVTWTRMTSSSCRRTPELGSPKAHQYATLCSTTLHLPLDFESPIDNPALPCLNPPRSQKGKLKRLRRRRSSGSRSGSPDPTQLANIFDDPDDDRDSPRAFDDDEMAGFIEDDSQSDSDGGRARESEDDDERRARRKREKKERRKGKGARRAGFGSSMVEGIGQEAWQEVTDVFGNGQDYGYALEEDEAIQEEKELKDVG